jgi:glycosyltransferase involved in cell wall biosynthesis
VQSDKSTEPVLNAPSSLHHPGGKDAGSVRTLDDLPLAAVARACVLTSVHPPFDIRIFHKECKSLAAAGYDVSLLAPCAHDQVVDGIRLRAVPKGKNRFERLTRTLWSIYRRAVRENAEIYHFHDPELIPVGLALHFQGKKVIYDVHEDLPRCMPYKSYLPKWLGKSAAWVVELLENASCRFFSGLVTATPSIAARFCRLNKRTVVVHNYPLMTELASMQNRPWESRDMTIAYVGSAVSVQRGALEMVRAMGLLPDDLEASLALAGPFSPPDLQDALAREHGWNRVRLCGVLDRRGVAEVLSRARVGLVLQYPEPNAMAGKPIKLFEYMAAGIPVLSADFPLWRQVVEGAGCGLCVDPLNPGQISLAIRYLLTHPGEAEAMGRRGRRAIKERFNWDREKRKLLSLYGELTKKSGAGDAWVAA